MGFLENKRAMLLKGDCSDRLKDLPDESVDLVFTSPPYADRREHDYSTASEKLYVEWFLPIADQLFRVLKPTGSFVLNIKEGTKDNMKMAYVYELLLALRGRGWLWTDLDRRMSGTSSRDIMNEHKRKKDKRTPKRVLGV